MCLFKIQFLIIINCDSDIVSYFINQVICEYFFNSYFWLFVFFESFVLLWRVASLVSS